MFKLLLLCIVIAIGVWAGVAMQATTGYVGISVLGWTFEAPMWLAIIGVLLAFSVLLLIWKIVKIFLNFGEFIAGFRERWRKKKTRKHCMKGLAAFYEGEWAVAEKNLISGAKYSELPFIYYLSAAKAAQEQGEIEKRDEYLKLAGDSNKESTVAVGIVRSQLLSSQGEWQQSLATLKALHTNSGHHPEILRLLKKGHIQLKEWREVLDLIPLLVKAKVLSEEEARSLQRRCYRELLLQGQHNYSLEEMSHIWHEIPRSLQQDRQLVYIYASMLNMHGKAEVAETLIRQTLKKQWDDGLVRLYGLIKTTYSNKQLAQAEHWLKSHDKDTGLLLTLGRLCLHNQLWGKAERYFEISLSLEPCAETYAELGRLYEQLDKTDQSIECFRKGLLLSAPSLYS